MLGGVVMNWGLSDYQPSVGDEVVVVRGRLRGFGGRVAIVNDAAIEVVDDHATERRGSRRWLTMTRVRKGDVVKAEAVAS